MTIHKGAAAWGTDPDLDRLPVFLRDYRGFDSTGRTQALDQSRSEQGGAQ